PLVASMPLGPSSAGQNFNSLSFFMSSTGMSSLTEVKYLISSMWLHFLRESPDSDFGFNSLVSIVSRSTVFLTPKARRNLSLTFEQFWTVGRSSNSFTEGKKDSLGRRMPSFVGIIVKCTNNETTLDLLG